LITDVSKRFRGMNLSPTTTHIHVFDQFNNKNKLNEGSNISYNTKTTDIRFKVENKIKEVFTRLNNPINVVYLNKENE